MGEKQIVDIIKSKAKEIEEELVSIRHELHKHPELGVELHETHDIISRELHKIPELEVQEHKAGGSGVIAILHGGKPEGKTVLLRADIDALPIEEKWIVHINQKNRDVCMPVVMTDMLHG